MDTATGTATLQGQTVQTIAEQYFNSVNDPHSTKLHIVENRKAVLEEIEVDVKTWYSGFMSCAKLLGPGANLPPIESLLPVVTKQFAEKVRIAA